MLTPWGVSQVSSLPDPGFLPLPLRWPSQTRVPGIGHREDLRVILSFRLRLSGPGSPVPLTPHIHGCGGWASASSAPVFRVWSLAERTQRFRPSGPLPAFGLNLWGISVDPLTAQCYHRLAHLLHAGGPACFLGLLHVAWGGGSSWGAQSCFLLWT